MHASGVGRHAQLPTYYAIASTNCEKLGAFVFYSKNMYMHARVRCESAGGGCSFAFTDVSGVTNQRIPTGKAGCSSI